MCPGQREIKDFFKSTRGQINNSLAANIFKAKDDELFSSALFEHSIRGHNAIVSAEELSGLRRQDQASWDLVQKGLKIYHNDYLDSGGIHVIVTYRHFHEILLSYCDCPSLCVYPQLARNMSCTQGTYGRNQIFVRKGLIGH